MMDRMTMVPAFEKLSLAGNTDTEQVISGVSCRKNSGPFGKLPSTMSGIPGGSVVMNLPAMW